MSQVLFFQISNNFKINKRYFCSFFNKKNSLFSKRFCEKRGKNNTINYYIDINRSQGKEDKDENKTEKENDSDNLNHNNISNNSGNPNFTDFNDYFSKDRVKKAHLLNIEDKKYYENISGSASNEDIHKSRTFNLKAQKRINQSKNFISQRKNLAINIKKELEYFKLNENFKLDDLRKKYLFFAKMYHPDSAQSDNFTGESFNILRNNYEKLKAYCEMRDKLIDLEKNIEEDGTILTDRYEFEWPDAVGQPEKHEIMKELILENEFGDIKEPKNLIQKLIFVWFLIGSFVVLVEFKKFSRKYKIKRENVDYNKPIKELLF